MKALRRSIAFLVLAGFVSLQGAVWVAAHHAALEDDSACAGVDGPALIGPHHQSGSLFEETNPPSPLEHCAFCHMQRVVGGARLTRVVAIHTPPHVMTPPAESVLARYFVVVRGASPRGPPSLIA